jgi:opacity protein-like surface antigen
MKGLFKGIAALGVVAALGATSAQAQQESGNLITVGAGGGIAIPLGDYSDFTKTGWDFTGGVQFKPATSPVGFQLDGTYQQNKFDPSSAGKDDWVYGTANIVYWLPLAAETKIRPYLLGGGGIYHVKDKPTIGTDTSFTKFGINVGAGFDFNVQKNVGIFIEGRFHNVFVEGPDAKFIPINAGIRFHTM